MAIGNTLERLRFILAAGEILPQFFKRGDGLLDRLRVSVDRLGHPEMAFRQTELGIDGQLMGSMQFQEMLVFDDGLGKLLLVEERLAALHDHVRIVVLLDRVAEEDLLIRAAYGFGVGGRLRFAGASSRKP